MTKLDMALFLYEQMNKQRKLAKIWRAIARRQLSRLHAAERDNAEHN